MFLVFEFHVTILKNNVPVISDLLTTSEEQTFTFGIAKNEKELILTIISTDEGDIPPNTVKLILINGVQRVKIISPLKKNQKISIRLVKK